ncbi:phage tail protein [Pasteurellaceae bacterium Pebbles2]|nr:phage tail protein [Pasteurellaceae bacterium Pebbles2]
MVKVRFYGSLKQFGTTFQLDVKNTSEAIYALTSQLKGLRQALMQGWYKVRIGRDYLDEHYLEKGLSYHLKDGDTVHFTPVVAGAKKGGVFQAILGATLIGAAFLLGPVGMGVLASNSALMLGGIGASMLLGGVAQMLTKQPSMSSANSEKKSSTAFSNLANMVAQGKSVPLAYGRIRTGSLIISQGVSTQDYSN